MEAKYSNSFIGQIGMRYMQRPKKTKSKVELDKFLAKCYIENIWTFRKGEKKFDLFKGSTLEEFFV